MLSQHFGVSSLGVDRLFVISYRNISLSIIFIFTFLYTANLCALLAQHSSPPGETKLRFGYALLLKLAVVLVWSLGLQFFCQFHIFLIISYFLCVCVLVFYGEFVSVVFLGVSLCRMLMSGVLLALSRGLGALGACSTSLT